MRLALRGILGVLALGTVVVGCGDKETNPDAVTVSELKYPGNLVAWDQGDGTVWLEWSGSNNENDFDGYNVYGVKGKPLELGVTHGKAIELLDDKGEKITASDAILAKFNYDSTKKLGLAAELADTATTGTSSDAPKFSALPIHTGGADARLLPTCKPKDGTCTLTSATSKGTNVKSDGTLAVNGRVVFKLTDPLTIGEDYCFFVLSSMDGGKKVSQTTSNVACLKPKKGVKFNLTLPASASLNQQFDVLGFAKACAAGTCTDPTAGSTPFVAKATDKEQHTASDTIAVYIETTSTADKSGLVPGKGSAINDLGYYALGLADPTLPKTAPTLVLDSDLVGGTTSNKEAPIFNQGGYSIAGQTVPLSKGHVYIIATKADLTTGTDVGPFYYTWLYVSADLTASTAVEMRVPKASNEQ